MNRYDKAFKEEAVRLSDEIGPKKAAEQLGVAYHTLQGWRKQRTLHWCSVHNKGV
ncbi:transposase IS3/IS911 family protein [Paenibacillus algicola]|uniref:Transposase IS3/IS911 family protein n=1 Tax=Paenibacillus algicola TaxID=2565926 RepID=A0A4P8XP25_9BACL|nr:transposase [Paenibacillus algicola]QCT04378.1 transposase IS3/IS911 family protein [Paenibacillus algicola]